MPADLDKLEAAAKAATPGAWFIAPNGSAYYGSEPAIFSTVEGSSGHKICSAAWGFGTERGRADYAFIAAANPAAILELVERVRKAEKALKVVQSAARTLDSSKSAVIRELEKGAAAERIAIATLDSEREANALLTASAEVAEAEVVRLTGALTEAEARGYERAKEQAAKVPGFYIASKASHGARWRREREAGAPIISTWIDESGVGETSDWPDLWSRCISEASQAAALVVVRLEGETLKGAWVEVGAALACGVPVFAVGCGEFSIRHHPLFTECASAGDAFRRATEAATAIRNMKDKTGE